MSCSLTSFTTAGGCQQQSKQQKHQKIHHICLFLIIFLELLLKDPVASYKLLPFSHRFYSVTTYIRPTAKTSMALSFLSPGSNSKFFIWTKKPTSGSGSYLHICLKPKAYGIFKEFQGLPQMYFKQKANDKLVAEK